MKKSKKKRPKKDQHAAREAKKYERPIVSREFILDFLSHFGQPMTKKALADELKLKSDTEKEALRRRLRAMVRDGQLVKNRKGGYGPIDKMDLIKGRVSGHSEGFGFLIPDDSSGQDLYLSARQMRGVMHGDRVLGRIVGMDHRGRKEGQVVEVIERGTQQIVGRFQQEAGIAYVVPSDQRLQDIVIPEHKDKKVNDGQIVCVDIVEQPSARSQPIGNIVEILGDHMAPGMEVEVAIRNYNLPHVWPEKVLKEVEDLPEEVGKKDLKDRKDLRSLAFVTIDGEDAKDFDDAVYCYQEKNKWHLFVAIADVSHYVKPNSALDQEAVIRGNSVYFPGRVIPMLPTQLSNHLCSLNPNKDRLVMVCEMVLDAQGKRLSYQFYPAVIHSKARMTYNNVAAILVNKDRKLAKQYAELLPHFEDLYSLYQVFRKNRSKRGAIDFETTETRIVFGKNKKIEQIKPVFRNDAHMLIEEFMIAANTAAAEFLEKSDLPGIFRIHDGPKADKLEELRAFLKEFGLQLGGKDNPEPSHYASIIKKIKDRPDARLIQTILLRSLSQAVYSTENIGHFGLSFEAYTHFTSPIRRYPDLMVHRTIKQLLQDKKKFRYSEAEVLQIADLCSTSERRADEATRDAESWLKCEFMLEKVGLDFSGIVTGVTSFGVFVELNEIFVEGLVHVTSLDNDYYHFDPVRHMLVGERTHKTYRIGDAIDVTVARVDLDERHMDFVLA